MLEAGLGTAIKISPTRYLLHLDSNQFAVMMLTCELP
jgi:hypothetical protein